MGKKIGKELKMKEIIILVACIIILAFIVTFVLV